MDTNDPCHSKKVKLSSKKKKKITAFNWKEKYNFFCNSQLNRNESLKEKKSWTQDCNHHQEKEGGKKERENNINPAT